MFIFVASVLFYETKDFFDAKWMKVFYHYSGSGVLFSNSSEALNCDQLNKFSVLGGLNGNYAPNGKFEFLLEYPGILGYNRWKQTHLPYLNPEVNGQCAIGYEPVSISWNSQYWCGLVASSHPEVTVLDGSAGFEEWYYSIGTMKDEWWPKYIPGPGVLVNEVKLWIRIDNIPTKKMVHTKSFFNCLLMNFFIGFLSS